MTVLELCDFLYAEMQAGRIRPEDKTNIRLVTIDRVWNAIRFAIAKARA